MIAATEFDPASAGIFAAGGILMAVGVALGLLFQQHLARRAERAEPAVIDVPRRREHTAHECGSSGDLVRDHLVTTSGLLSGLCPGCGAPNVPCTQVDRTWQYGPWVIDEHAPYIDPDYGLHSGACWTRRLGSGDFDTECICGEVTA